MRLALLLSLSLLSACEPPARRIPDPKTPAHIPFLAPDAIASVSLSDEDLCVRLKNGGVLCRKDWNPSPGATPRSFVPIYPNGDVLDVGVGGAHACVRRGNGAVECWGSNEAGEVYGPEMIVASPRVVPISGAVAQLGLGRDRTCGLLIDGRVICWGTFRGVRIAPAPLVGVNDAIEIALSETAMCLRRKSGAVLCARGDGPMIGVSGLDRPVELAIGMEHGCARDADGLVACWPMRKPDMNGVKPSVQAIAVEGLTNVQQLASGDAHVCARRSDRSVLCWGSNEYGQLGDGTRLGRATPGPVYGLSDAIDLIAGGRRACARRATGALVCWGRDLLDDPMFHALTGMQSPPGPPSDDDSLVPEPLRVPGALVASEG